MNIQLRGIDRAVTQANQLRRIMDEMARRRLSYQFGGNLAPISALTSALSLIDRRGKEFASAFGRNIFAGVNLGAIGKTIGRGFLYQVGFGIANLTGQAIRQGTEQADIGAARMRQFPFTAGERT